MENEFASVAVSELGRRRFCLIASFAARMPLDYSSGYQCAKNPLSAIQIVTQDSGAPELTG
jgi:hypothetical protein